MPFLNHGTLLIYILASLINCRRIESASSFQKTSKPSPSIKPASSYYHPYSTTERSSTGYNRINFLGNLMAILRAGKKPPVSTWTTLFGYYEFESYFTEASVALLIFDFYTIANYIPFVIESQISYIMTQIIGSETPLNEEQFVNRFSSSTTLLIQIYDYLAIKNTSVNANNKNAILQVPLDKQNYDKFKPSSFYESIKEKIRDLLKKDENTVFKITGVKNPNFYTFDYIVEMVKPINLFSLPKVFVFENAQKLSFQAHFAIYANEVMPLDHLLHPCDCNSRSSVKNLEVVLGNVVADICSRLRVSKIFAKNHNCLSEQDSKFINEDKKTSDLGILKSFSKS